MKWIAMLTFCFIFGACFRGSAVGGQDAESLDLRAYQWSHRLLIIGSPSADDSRYRALVQALEHEAQSLQDRDMLHIMLRLSPLHIQVGRSISASSATVWRLLTDTHGWWQWGPSIAAVECDERYIRGGSRGRVKTRLGFWLPFVVTHYEHGRYWHWRVSGIPATGHRVEPLGATRCCLVFEIPVWAAPYSIVCGLALRRIVKCLGP